MKLAALVDALRHEAAEAPTPFARLQAAELMLQRYLKAPELESSLICKSTRYARYLLYNDPLDRLSAMALVWASGQFSPLHDHDRTWCVEAIVCGELDVQEYDAHPLPDDRMDFRPTRLIKARQGAICSLYPPQEYHAVMNGGPRPVVSIHVYGHELKHVRSYLPVRDSIYAPRRCSLSYDGSLIVAAIP